jgi:signal transduction histidine kinase
VATIDLALRVFLDDDHSHFPDDGEHRIERHALGTIQRASGRMYRLIHDLLDLSRAEGGRLTVQPAAIDPATLIADALEAHATLAEARAIVLETSTEPSLPCVLADRERVAQVLSNLIGNALKFTPASGRIRVAASRSGTSVRLVVEDTGRGIAAQDLPHVFDRFWQAQRTNRDGTGLGLSIARAIVEAHGGTIGVDSTLGAGARFYFTLRGAEDPDAPAMTGARCAVK